MKHAEATFNWDLDEELSEIYLRKDLDQFWKKMEILFFKKVSKSTKGRKGIRPVKN